LAEQFVFTMIAKMKESMREFFFDSFVTLWVNKISGDYVEFGSWGGNSLSLAYEAIRAVNQPRHLWAFDSFSGLPEVTDARDERWRSGIAPEGQGGVDAFHAACAEHGVPREAYTAIEGYYDDTLPQLGTDQAPKDIALAYVDCNMYASTVSVLEFLAPRLKHGMIVAFDDYWLWTEKHASGERIALHEFQAAHPEWTWVRYKDVHYTGVAFVIERSDSPSR
jgi:hypothetical protein